VAAAARAVETDTPSLLALGWSWSGQCSVVAARAEAA
jgi:dienelactone hydrolase